MLPMMYIFLLVFFGVIVFHAFVRYGRRGRIAAKIPGPVGFPVIGNMLNFDLSTSEKLWAELKNTADIYYPITKIWTMTQAVILIRHPDDLEILLTSQKTTEKGWVYEYLHPWLKTGLITNQGDKWRQRRKMLTPAFHFNILKKYMDITEEQGESLIRHIRAAGKESVHTLEPLFSTFTLNIISEAAMGVSFDELDAEFIENYKEAIHKFGSFTIYRILRPYMYDWMFKFFFPFLKIYREQKQALVVLHEFTDKIVKKRKEYHEQTGGKYLEKLNDEETDDVYIVGKKRLAMLDLLLLAERNGLIDYAGIKEEVDTVTFAGHDTISTAMTFVLMLFAENKLEQDKARAEVTETMNKHNGKLGINETQELHYLERCIKESLRLYPPASIIFRYISEDMQLKHALIPANTHVMCNFFCTHRDPKFWENPNKFNPDRFLAENMQNRHPFAYVPFSAGPRNCIGQKLAMVELKSLVGKILYNFHLESIDRLEDIDLIADIVIRPLKPVQMKFIQIKK